MSSGHHVNKRRLANEAKKPGAGVEPIPMQEKDAFGIPLRHPSFIKRNCKMCLGRGTLTKIVHGTKEVEGKKVSETTKHEILCGCATSKYLPVQQKVATEIDAELKKIGLEQKIVQGGMGKKNLDPEREAERSKAARSFLPAILKKFGFSSDPPPDLNTVPPEVQRPADNRA